MRTPADLRDSFAEWQVNHYLVERGQSIPILIKNIFSSQNLIFCFLSTRPDAEVTQMAKAKAAKKAGHVELAVQVL